MATKKPDLSHTVVDSETGEVLHQAPTGPEVERIREERKADWKDFYARREARRRHHALAQNS